MKSVDLQSFATRMQSLQQARARVDRAQTIAVTGLANVRGADDPSWLDANARTTSALLSSDRARKSLDVATRRLTAVDDSLAGVGDVLARLQEIAVQGGSDTYGAGERRILAEEVRSLKAATLSAANTRDGDAYLFGGFLNATEPYDATGAFVGDTSVMQVQAGLGLTTAAGIDATSVFSPASGTNIFSLFDSIETALDTNNAAAVRSQLGAVQNAIGQVADGRGEAGDKLTAAERFMTWLDASDERTKNERASGVEADPLRAYSELAQTTSALEGALKASAQAMKMSLVDFL